jgi:hypothetical protein
VLLPPERMMPVMTRLRVFHRFAREGYYPADADLATSFTMK